MNRNRRHIIIVFMLCLMSTLGLSNETANAYVTTQHTKSIHIVFDDSGSMISDNNEYVDRWCQAKYALEVFAAMLEEKDDMRVYFMSDFDLGAGGKVNASVRIVMSGAETSEARVAKVHNTVTGAANTSFDTVIKAYSELKNTDADEQWLVILTDGEFNRLNGAANTNIDVDGYLSQYVNESDVKIIFLSMGDDAAKIQGDPSRGIYSEQAATSSQILGKITSICNQIFNRNKLRFSNEARREFSFDVPMTEILIFAQGDNVKINGIKGGETYTPSSVVNVKYSETATTNPNYDKNQVKVARDLTGVVAAFRDIPKGAYSLDVTGAQTVEIYYKPDVAVDVRLYQNGEEIRAKNVVEGEYQVRFGMTNENGDFFESELFGKVDYDVTVTNGDEEYSVKSGDSVNLKRGEYSINVSSRFLDVNTIENTITGRVLSNTISCLKLTQFSGSTSLSRRAAHLLPRVSPRFIVSLFKKK